MRDNLFSVGEMNEENGLQGEMMGTLMMGTLMTGNLRQRQLWD